MPELTKAYLAEEYGRKERSIHEIAEECSTYPNKVRRALIKHGLHLRDKSEAQKVAIKSGRHPHPTKGKHRDQATKNRIGESVAKAWEVMSEEDRSKHANRAKQQWDAMSEGEREEMRRLAAEGVRRAATEGSKLEQYLLVGLRASGYTVEFHKEFVTAAEKQHIDLFLPTLRVAIEIDGPSHFLPIWGEDRLERTIFADQKKTGLLMQAGYLVIRIKNLSKSLSEIRHRSVLKNLIDVLHSESPNRFIEIEVK